jgi:hypothetical protein
LGFSASGINPQMAVIDVSTTGKKRVSPAIFIASSMLCPSARNWLVKSTSNNEFLTCIPDLTRQTNQNTYQTSIYTQKKLPLEESSLF